MSDKRAAEYYEDPEHLRVRPGSGRRRSSSAPKSLGSHVPVRFSVTDIERIRTAAREDGRTVSSWIRWLVQRELDRRSPIRGQTALSSWNDDQQLQGGPSARTRTQARESTLVLR